MFLLFLIGVALGGPVPIVAIGDGLVSGAPPASEVPSPDAVPGGWVSVVGDCLEERQPSRFTVIDCTVAHATASGQVHRLETVRALEPALILVGLGAQELAADQPDFEAFGAAMTAILTDLGNGVPIVLVGVVPRVAKSGADDRVPRANTVLAEIAAGADHVSYVDPRTDWPDDAAAHDALVLSDGRLSDLGHARIGAVVCAGIITASNRTDTP